MAVVKGITKAKADAINAPILSDANLNGSGELVFTRESGTSPVNVGVVVGQSVPKIPSLVTLSAFDKTSVQVVVPKWHAPGHPNDKVADPATLPTGQVLDVAWTKDGIYVAVASTATPRVLIYKRNGDTFTKLANPATLPGDTVWQLDWSPDGQYLACAAGTQFLVYKRSGDTLTKLSDPVTLPTDCRAIEWSPDGVYLAVGQFTTSPKIIVYKRSGDVLTKLSDPATLPTGAIDCLAWSPDGKYLAMGQEAAPTLFIYSRSGDVFTKLADPSFLPSGQIQGMAWSIDGRYLYLGSYLPGFTVYRRNGSTFTSIAVPNDIDPSNASKCVSVSPDGRYLAVMCGSNAPDTPMYFYEVKNETYTKVKGFPPPYDMQVTLGKWSPDGVYFAANVSSPTYVAFFKSAMGQIDGIPIAVELVP